MYVTERDNNRKFTVINTASGYQESVVTQPTKIHVCNYTFCN